MTETNNDLNSPPETLLGTVSGILILCGILMFFGVLISNTNFEKNVEAAYPEICSSPHQISPSDETFTVTRTVPVTFVSIISSTLTGEEDMTDEKKCMLSKNYAGKKYEISYLNEKGETETIQIPTRQVVVDFSDENVPSTLRIVTVVFPEIADKMFTKSPAIRFVRTNKEDPSKMEYDTYFLNTTPL